jgi:hypothetical protein
MNSKKINNIERYGKTSRGKKELLKHLEGGRLTLKQATFAYCYDCSGYFADGKKDCKVSQCPLHPFMPFNPVKRKRRATVSQDMPSFAPE